MDACFCAVQVGVVAPHDHVRTLHHHHEVGLRQSPTRLQLTPLDARGSVGKRCPDGCRFNSQILVFVTRQFRSVKPCCPGSEDRREDKMGEDASACNTSMVLLNKGRDGGLNDLARFGAYLLRRCPQVRNLLRS